MWELADAGVRFGRINDLCQRANDVLTERNELKRGLLDPVL